MQTGSKKLGISEYAQRFADNDIDASVLPESMDQDLNDLGVSLGDRRKMLRATRDISGASVAAAAPSAPAATESARQDDAERRHLAVMFCGLVGSTALSTCPSYYFRGAATARRGSTGNLALLVRILAVLISISFASEKWLALWLRKRLARS